ncbi:MAG: HPF/RaiA family ribosome-associated protein [Aromatoleum sp.]|jgi:ribosome-associated translation inhibitor RaiA|uniref:HPF/RaiA family ribosome-associated protein n=1 Tax=Aromatoleum sp. TaxID=2307007 RepID=UPI002893D0AC|nr:HPF/RaiA family ribosome-associated protein [Aromatoleum sp.]MDT3672175.1 HPF/RaiA family ribosome-associated protein [Aromatoleum sp.]
MQLPLQIVFHGLDPSDAIEARIRGKVEKLETFHQGIMSCRVTVEQQRGHRNHDHRFNVRIDLHIPGHELAINRNHDADVYVALRDAFNAAGRLLEDEVQQQRGAVKAHELPQHGRIARLDVDGGHGYIETATGEEVYFGRENVTGPPFENIEVGAEVRFLLEPGKNALLARRVTVGKHDFGA